ncbi:MAG: NAD-dependent epimerase/dehydratase family protein [Eubacteriales bacterium]
MESCLIGYTGFVGSNIAEQMPFDDLYNSKNINDIKGKDYDLIVCAGIRAEKYLANKYPEDDLNAIKDLIDILETVACKRFVLISTIDVYDRPVGADEDTVIDEKMLHPYGKNRLFMEKWVSEHFDHYNIIRLPALFGKGLKKNFVYDCLTKIPTMIMAPKFDELSAQDESAALSQYYKKDDNGNYVFDKKTNEADKAKLKAILEELGFTSLIFTDSRSRFPFYYLKFLSEHIKTTINNDIRLINFATEPITAKEAAKEVFGIDFDNEKPNADPINYDFKTKYYDLFHGSDGYLFDKETIYKQLKEFVGEF